MRLKRAFRNLAQQVGDDGKRIWFLTFVVYLLAYAVCCLRWLFSFQLAGSVALMGSASTFCIVAGRPASRPLY